jgi:hypothetical protein
VAVRRTRDPSQSSDRWSENKICGDNERGDPLSDECSTRLQQKHVESEAAHSGNRKCEDTCRTYRRYLRRVYLPAVHLPQQYICPRSVVGNRRLRSLTEDARLDNLVTAAWANKQWPGRSTLEITRRYANLMTEDLQAVHERVSLLAR